jgi:2-iminoacetate synthase ThiH
VGNFALLDRSRFDPCAPDGLSAYNFVGGSCKTGSDCGANDSGGTDNNDRAAESAGQSMSSMVPF